MKIFIIVLLLVFPVLSAADDCANVSDIAETIMQERQENVPLKTLVAKLGGLEKPELKKLSIAIAVDAYRRPIMILEENKKKYVVEFGSRWYLKCMEDKAE